MRGILLFFCLVSSSFFTGSRSASEYDLVEFLDRRSSVVETNKYSALMNDPSLLRRLHPNTETNHLTPAFLHQHLCGLAGNSDPDCEIRVEDLVAAVTDVSYGCLEDLQFLAQSFPKFTQAAAGSAACGKNKTCTAYYTALMKKYQFAPKQFDSFSKGEAGTLNGNTHWFGNYEECRSIKTLKEKSMMFPVGREKYYEGKTCVLLMPSVYYIAQVLQESSVFNGFLDTTPNTRTPPSTTTPVTTSTSTATTTTSTSPTPTTTSTTTSYSTVTTTSPKPPPEQCPYNPYSMVQQGVCVPASCTDHDVFEVFKNIKEPTTQTQLYCGVQCLKNEVPYSLGAMIVIVVTVTWFAFCIVATAFDYFAVKPVVDSLPNTLSEEERAAHSNTMTKKEFLQKQPLMNKVFVAASLYSNGKRILNTKQLPGQINSIHGIRVVSMTWVILGHSYLVLLGADNTIELIPKQVKIFMNQTWMNATVSVDTFFFLSGFLLSYLWFKRMTKTPKLVRSPYVWFMYYVHRYLRLTPVYGVVMAVYIFLYSHMTSGPMWHQDGPPDIDACNEYWWTNLLYVNNLVNPNKLCLGVTWYLGNDMQFHWVAPILLLLFYLSWIPGVLITIILTGGCIAYRFYTVFHYHLPAASTAVGHIPDPLAPNLTASSTWYNFGDSGPSAFNFRFMYVAPWSRYAPYIIGILVGYVMQRNKKIRMHWVVALVGWLVSIGTGLAIVYGLYDYSNKHHMAVEYRAFYAAFSRPVWAICVAWVVFACHYGYGGPINGMLSWRGFIPVSRLTYCAYLIHLFIGDMISYNAARKPHFSGHFDWLARQYCPMVFLAYFTSFFLSAMVEHPVAIIEDMIFGISSHKQGKRDDDSVRLKSAKFNPGANPDFYLNQGNFAKSGYTNQGFITTENNPNRVEMKGVDNASSSSGVSSDEKSSGKASPTLTERL